MSYATVAQYVQEFGLTETAQLLEDDEALVTDEVLKAKLASEDAADTETQEAIDRAVTRLTHMLEQSANLMNGYIAKYLPLTQPQIDKTPLKTCNLELARCQLMEDSDNGTEQQEKRCKKWHDWLRDIARPNGGAQLVIDDSSKDTANTRKIHQGQSQSHYNWDNYP